MLIIKVSRQGTPTFPSNVLPLETQQVVSQCIKAKKHRTQTQDRASPFDSNSPENKCKGKGIFSEGLKTPLKRMYWHPNESS